IDEATKRAALKKLFSDPSFNVMDGLDIYVGDYTQADPMPTGMLEKLSAVYAMLDPVAPPADDNEADRASDKNVATPNADAVVESVPIAPITPAAPATQALPLGDAAMPDTDAVNSAPDSDDPAPTKRQ
ncbi:MAG: DUF3306 domain-containing protein, partial [Betaproteobacteria bacterium]